MDRIFDPERHIIRVDDAPDLIMDDGRGGDLEGVTAKTAMRAFGFFEMYVGLDRIAMSPGSWFEPHVHPGDHILFVMEGEGLVVIDGVRHEISPGDAIFIPSEFAHGVSTKDGYEKEFVLLSFGVPHKPADAPDRMRLVHQEADR